MVLFGNRTFRPAGVALVSALILCLVSGCASGPGSRFTREAGVPVIVTESDGTKTTGTLVSYSGGALVVDRAYPKNDRLSVVRVNDRDVALLDGAEIGLAVEIREFDVVVRGPVPLDSIEEARVRSRAYYGWGTIIAAGLAYALVTILEEQ